MSVPLHVLILGDRSSDAAPMLDALRQAGFAPDGQRAETEAGLLAHLDAGLDLILADYALAQPALRLLRERGLDIPLIVVSGFVGEEAAAACIQQGAADFVCRDHLARLGPAAARVLDAKRQTGDSQSPGQDVIARKLTEEALRESEERYRLLFELEADAIFLIDNETGQLLDANAVASELYGYSREELLRKKNTDLSVEPDKTRHVTTHGGTFVPVRWHRKKDGSIFPVEITGRHFAWRGRPVHIAAIRDITERVRAASVLRESEGKYRQLIDTLQEGIWVIDKDAYTTFVNPHMAEILGYSVEEMQGKHLFSFMDAQGVEIAKRHLEHRQQGIKEQHEFEFLRQDGSRIYATLETGPLTDEQGNYVGAIAGVQDVTARKQAEDTLRESEARFRSMFNMAVDAIFVANQEGRFVEVNPAACKQLGYTREELLQMRVFDIVMPDYLPRAQERLSKMQAEAGVFESMHKHRDGTAIPVELSITRIEYQGKPAMLGIARDISEELEREEQLRQAQKMEAVGQLAGGVAHDLNNLLTPILGYAELLLLDQPPGAANHDDLLQIRKAAQSARDLTRQLLAFGRRQMLEIKTIDLNQVITGLAKILRRAIREDIQIDIQLAPSPGWVRADGGQIEQILMNLALNAQDAMRQGGSMTIQTAHVTLDEAFAQANPGAHVGRHVMLAFSDTGSGMDRDTLEHLFEPFFTTKERGRGTGLGLATVYGIVRQHEGSILVSSDLGHGTTFKIYLPSAGETPEGGNQAPRETKSQRGHETVLVVEDNDLVRNMALQILKRSGYEVLSAANATECMRLSEQHPGPIHLLLSDVIMPQMNGRELYRRLASSRPEMKALFMSGYSQDVISYQGILEEGVQFIQKPFTPQALTDRVRRVLDG